MNKPLLLIDGLAILVVLVPTVWFFSRALAERHTNPRRLQNGLWFALAALTFPLTGIFLFVTAPAAFLVFLVSVFLPYPKAKPVMAFSLGYVAASVFWFTFLGLLNTYAVPS